MAHSLMQRQGDLFPPPVAEAAPRLSHVERLWQLAFSDEVKEEVMQIVQARAGEWLAWEAFRSIIEKHKIGSCFGHLLHRMVRDGQLLEQIWYFGSEHPGQGNYLGFGGRWGSIGTEGPRVLTYTCGGGPKPLAGDLLPVRGRAV